MVSLCECANVLKLVFVCVAVCNGMFVGERWKDGHARFTPLQRICYIHYLLEIINCLNLNYWILRWIIHVRVFESEEIFVYVFVASTITLTHSFIMQIIHTGLIANHWPLIPVCNIRVCISNANTLITQKKKNWSRRHVCARTFIFFFFFVGKVAFVFFLLSVAVVHYFVSPHASIFPSSMAFSLASDQH